MWLYEPRQVHTKIPPQQYQPAPACRTCCIAHAMLGVVAQGGDDNFVATSRSSSRSAIIMTTEAAGVRGAFHCTLTGPSAVSWLWGLSTTAPKPGTVAAQRSCREPLSRSVTDVICTTAWLLAAPPCTAEGCVAGALHAINTPCPAIPPSGIVLWCVCATRHIDKHTKENLIRALPNELQGHSLRCKASFWVSAMHSPATQLQFLSSCGGQHTNLLGSCQHATI